MASCQKPRLRGQSLAFLLMSASALALFQDTAASAGIQGTYFSPAEDGFRKALDAYRDGRMDQAREQLQQLLEFPVHQRTTAATLMLSRVLFRLGEHGDALETAQALERRFSDSRYVPFARLLSGDCQFLLKSYHEAANCYGRILATPTPLPVQARAAERLAAMADNGMISADALERIRAAVGEERLREALLYGRARWYGRLGWRKRSREAVETYLDSIRDGIFAHYARAEGRYPGGKALAAAGGPPVAGGDRSAGVSAAAGGGRRLGLLLPLSGSGFERQVGEDLHAGVQLANEEAGEPLDLVVADTGTDYGDLPIVETESSRLVRVIQQTQRLIYDDGVAAIVGPVFSSACAAAGVVARNAGVPLIAPLAQQTGLDQLGRNIFQLKPTPETEARALAEYATLVLGLRTLAIVSPLTDYGWSFEREFRRVAWQNGGEIVHADWYVPEATKDFRRVFEEIREVGFSLMAPPPEAAPVVDSSTSAPESTAEITERFFLSEVLTGLDEPEETLAAEKEAPPDSSEIFVDTIDGVVMVVEHFGDAQTIAPQLHYHRLETQILGNGAWYDPEGIRQMRPADRSYLEGTVLVSGYVEDESATRGFIDAFRRRFARDPGYAAFGYDAARLILAGRSGGYSTPGQLCDWLADVRDYEGASGQISFAKDQRSNTELELLKVDYGGRLRRVTDSDLPVLTGTRLGGPNPDAKADLPRGSLLSEEEEAEGSR